MDGIDLLLNRIEQLIKKDKQIDAQFDNTISRNSGGIETTFADFTDEDNKNSEYSTEWKNLGKLSPDPFGRGYYMGDTLSWFTKLANNVKYIHQVIDYLASSVWENYNENKTYYYGDTVSHKFRFYRCLVNGTKGITPSSDFPWEYVNTRDVIRYNNEEAIGRVQIESIKSTLQSLTKCAPIPTIEATYVKDGDNYKVIVAKTPAERLSKTWLFFLSDNEDTSIYMQSRGGAAFLVSFDQTGETASWRHVGSWGSLTLVKNSELEIELTSIDASITMFLNFPQSADYTPSHQALDVTFAVEASGGGLPEGFIGQLATPFVDTKAYEKGKLVSYQNVIYRALKDIAVGSDAPDVSSDFERVIDAMADEALIKKILGVRDYKAQGAGPGAEVTVNTLYAYNNKLWCIIHDHEGSSVFPGGAIRVNDAPGEDATDPWVEVESFNEFIDQCIGEGNYVPIFDHMCGDNSPNHKEIMVFNGVDQIWTHAENRIIDHSDVVVNTTNQVNNSTLVYNATTKKYDTKRLSLSTLFDYDSHSKNAYNGTYLKWYTSDNKWGPADAHQMKSIIYVGLCQGTDSNFKTYIQGAPGTYLLATRTNAYGVSDCCADWDENDYNVNHFVDLLTSAQKMAITDIVVYHNTVPNNAYGAYRNWDSLDELIGICNSSSGGFRSLQTIWIALAPGCVYSSALMAGLRNFMNLIDQSKIQVKIAWNAATLIGPQSYIRYCNYDDGKKRVLKFDTSSDYKVIDYGASLTNPAYKSYFNALLKDIYCGSDPVQPIWVGGTEGNTGTTQAFVPGIRVNPMDGSITIPAQCVHYTTTASGIHFERVYKLDNSIAIRAIENRSGSIVPYTMKYTMPMALPFGSSVYLATVVVELHIENAGSDSENRYLKLSVSRGTVGEMGDDPWLPDITIKLDELFCSSDV